MLVRYDGRGASERGTAAVEGALISPEEAKPGPGLTTSPTKFIGEIGAGFLKKVVASLTADGTATAGGTSVRVGGMTKDEARIGSESSPPLVSGKVWPLSG
jgi:hypothetical protein